MMLPYKLDLETVVKAAKEYYLEKRLTAQYPLRKNRACTNRMLDPNSGIEYRCAIAACFPDEVLNQPFSTVEGGVSAGILLPPDDPLEWAMIVRIQSSHDYWAGVSKYEIPKKLERQLEAAFCEWLAKDPKEYAIFAI